MRNTLYFFEKQIRKLKEEASVVHCHLEEITIFQGSCVLVALSVDFSAEKRCLLESNG